MCVKKGNTFEWFWLFSRKQREGGWSQERASVLQVVARFATGQDHTEALGSVGCCSGWGGGPSLPVLRPLTPCAPWEGEGSPCPEWALGGSGTFKSSAQGGVGRDRRPRGSRALGGAARSVLVSSESRQCQVRGQDRQLGFASSLGPWEKSASGTRAAFWFVLAVWVPSRCARWRRGREGEGQRWGARRGLPGATPDFPGAGWSRAEGHGGVLL